MTLVEHQFYKFYKYEKGLKLGNSADTDHNGVKDEYVSTLENVVIPSFVEGYKVIRTGYKSLRNLPNLLTAFIPKTIEHMEGDTFVYCYKLHTVIFEENINLKTIEHYTFYHTNISSVVFPSSVKSIRYRSFYGCKNLKVVSIPNFLYSNVTNMFENAAENVSIFVPSNYPHDNFAERKVTKVLPSFHGIKRHSQANCRRTLPLIPIYILTMISNQ